jgi:hypothetical protein
VQVRSTWELLTSDFNPLELCSKLDPLLTSISALSSPMSAASPVKDLHMDQYTTPLKQVGCGLVAKCNRTADCACVRVRTEPACWTWQDNHLVAAKNMHVLDTMCTYSPTVVLPLLLTSSAIPRIAVLVPCPCRLRCCAC